MRPVTFVIPGDPESLTGGYLYDKRIMAGLASEGWQAELCRLDEGFPLPGPAARSAAAARLAALPTGRPVVVDGLAAGALPEEMKALAARLPLVILVHHPLGEESGLDSETAKRLKRDERRALAVARRVVVTSPPTARSLSRDYAVEPRRLGIVLPGTDPAPLARGSGGGEVALLMVATMTPRKGHLPLLEALAGLKALPWRLACVGSSARAPAHAARVVDRIRTLDLEARVRLVAEVPQPDLDGFYEAADLFVLPSLLEGYGMAHAEALARGLPLLTTTAAAIVETLPEGSFLAVPPGEVGALAAALERLLSSPAERERLAAGARRARGLLPTWELQARRFADELETLA